MDYPEVFYFSPWNTTRDLADSYNSCMELLEPHQWACFMDLDTIPCPHESFGYKIEEYINRYPEGVLFAGRTNRIAPAQQQVDVDEDNNDIYYHRKIGKRIENNGCFEVIEDDFPISGVCMVLQKKFWIPIEKDGMLGIDNFIHDVYKQQGRCYVMKGVYLYHWYGWRECRGRKTSHLEKDVNDESE